MQWMTRPFGSGITDDQEILGVVVYVVCKCAVKGAVYNGRCVWCEGAGIVQKFATLDQLNDRLTRLRAK